MEFPMKGSREITISLIFGNIIGLLAMILVLIDHLLKGRGKEFIWHIFIVFLLVSALWTFTMSVGGDERRSYGQDSGRRR